VGNDSYRDELEAARHRVRTLEAQVAEKDAVVDAREAELEELRRRIARLEEGVRDEPDEQEHRRWLPWAAVAVVVTIGSAVAAVMLSPDDGTRTQADVKAVVAAAATPPAQSLLWHGTPRREQRFETRRTPDVADVNGDGHDDVLGLVYTPGKEGHLHMGAFSGEDVEPLWLSEPVGRPATGIGDAFVLPSHDVVLVHATNGTVMVFDAATGAVKAKKHVEGVVRLCEGGDGPMAKTTDGGVVWHGGALSATRTSCEEPAPAPPRPSSPAVDDFEPVSFARSEGIAFALGSTGRLHQPVVVAYEPGAKGVLWRAHVTGDEKKLATRPWTQFAFAHGHRCVFVEVWPAELAESGPVATGARELVCLDEATGARRWTSDISDNGALVSSFVVGKDRLVLVRQTRVDILDPATGRSLGHVGWH
jgi:outer membrane protein assembly factor BamB